METAVRDSLSARGADLWPMDSLRRLKARNEWSAEHSPASVAELSRRTGKPLVAWMAAQAPQGRFERPWWSLFWTRRHWTSAATLYLADASGTPRTVLLSVERRDWLGFTGTNRGELWPITEPERSRAEALLLAELAGKAATALLDSTANSTTPAP
ncbi:MAG: hypothetical protein H6686_06485 [Fibrobacteria bacterium]|nr:hypothetical protein [Fibrobacteria bacterium]